MTPTAEGFVALAAKGNLAQNAEPKKGTFPQGDNLVLEPKLDGWRILAHVREASVDFFSRSGKQYNGKLPKVEAELLANLPPGTWLDGEVCSLSFDATGSVTDEWGTVQSVLSKMGGSGAVADKITYMVFDLLAHANIDARSLRFEKRRKLLTTLFGRGEWARVALVPSLPAAPHVHESLVEKGYEGSIVKRLDKPYGSNKREGAGWVKVKPTKTVEGVVMGFQPGKNGFAGMVGAVIFGQHDPASGALIERGKVSGMDGRTRLEMTNHPEKWLGKVIEVAHEGVSIGATDSGRFRFPRFKRVRPDRLAASVTTHDE